MNINTQYENLIVEIQEKIVICSLNRPKQLNALNSSVLKDLHLFFDSLYELLPRQNIAGVILTGAGDKAFVAGADIKEMSDLSPERAANFGGLGQDLTLKMEKIPVPIIACVNGFALGGGCEIAMACDFIYATTKSIFGQPEVKLGLIPGFGGTQRLSRYIGRNMAREIIYTGKNFDVLIAKEMGLVNQIFETKETMLTAAYSTLGNINKNSMLAVAKSKFAINEGSDLDIHQALKKELDCFTQCFESNDAKEGMKAFIEKRSAKFRTK